MHFAWLLILMLAGSACAQNTVRWVTNYYQVTGASYREIHDSMGQARPWKGKSHYDALTAWDITWKYQFSSTAGSCRCTSFTTETTITFTMPRWKQPTNANPELVSAWNRYLAALWQHELGHARVGLAAAAEQQRRATAFTAQADCDALRDSINTMAEFVIAEYGKYDKAYDEKTSHGATQGAVFGGGRRPAGEAKPPR